MTWQTSACGQWIERLKKMGPRDEKRRQRGEEVERGDSARETGDSRKRRALPDGVYTLQGLFATFPTGVGLARR